MDEHVCKPGAKVYWCQGEWESDCHGGFDVCCGRYDLHRERCPNCQRTFEDCKCVG